MLGQHTPWPPPRLLAPGTLLKMAGVIIAAENPISDTTLDVPRDVMHFACRLRLQNATPRASEGDKRGWAHARAKPVAVNAGQRDSALTWRFNPSTPRATVADGPPVSPRCKRSTANLWSGAYRRARSI